MLHFLSLTIENFGPFKGLQRIDFPSNGGVTIIWGNNGLGKTTLLNVFRYALFGKVHGRGSKTHSLKQIANWESYDEGVYGFKIDLTMNNDGDVLELTRQYSVRPGVAKPESDNDYIESVFLKNGTTILSNEKRDHVLNSIMPEQVSRFFLFDGELLQEYEDLLVDENSISEKIKEAIERILGVPVLTNGLVDVIKAEKDYGQSYSKVAQKNQATQQFGNMLGAKQAEQKNHEDELATLKTTLEDLQKERQSLEEEMQQTTKVRDWLKEKKIKEDIIEKKKETLEVKLNAVKELTKRAWQGKLSQRISDALVQLEAEINVYEDKKSKHLISLQLMDELKTGCRTGTCPVCGIKMDSAGLFVMKDKIASCEIGFEGLKAEEKGKLDELQGRRAQLKKLTSEELKVKIVMLESVIDDIRVEICDAEQRVNDLAKNIRESGINTSKAGAVSQKHAKCLQKIEATKDGITNEQGILNKVAAEIKNIEDKLKPSATGNAELIKAQKKLELCKKIKHVFERGVKLYRENLKQKVEKDASKIFVSISNQQEYTGLQINENYGLAIVHQTKRIVEIRSAGYEHIVALSLIGALHKNAPLQGPIIMDSPFGRLDPDHKRKITGVLPKLADQVLLLVYCGEIDEQEARKVLGSDLKNEYKLVLQTAFHTKIEKG